MNQRSTLFRLFGLTLLCVGATSASARADLVFDLGSTEVDLGSAGNLITATVDISLFNPMAIANPLAGYSLFLDIGPTGRELPAGVSFADDPVTYNSGNGTGLLFGASINGTENLTPAAGDIGLGQIQFLDSFVQPNQRVSLLTVHLEVDPTIATAGSFDIFLNPAGQSSISSLGQPQQAFTSTPGQLRLSASAVPEPSSLGLFGLAALGIMYRRKRRRFQ